eukprot:scaffold8589_cov99-Isochrysis_galbana.AAC.1
MCKGGVKEVEREGNGRCQAPTLGHRDGHEGQEVDALVGGEGRVDGGAEQVLAGEGEELLGCAKVGEDVLEAHVAGGAGGAEVHDVV